MPLNISHILLCSSYILAHPSKSSDGQYFWDVLVSLLNDFCSYKTVEYLSNLLSV